MTFAIRIAAAIAAALFIAIPANAQTILRSQTVSYDNIAALEAVPFDRFAAGAQVLLSDAGRAGLFVKVTSDQSALTTVDTAKCVFIPSPQDTDGSSGGWMRQEYLNGDPINAGWCGLGKSGNTAQNNADALLVAIDLAGVSLLEYNSANGAATQTASVYAPFGQYALATDTIFIPDGVTLDMRWSTVTAAGSGKVFQFGNGHASTFTYRAWLTNAWIVGDMTAQYAFDATPGLVGVYFSSAGMADGGVRDVKATRLATGFFCDGCFGVNILNDNGGAFSNGAASGAESGNLTIYGGGASIVDGGRYEFTNALGCILIDGDGVTSGSTTNLVIRDTTIQGCNASGIYARDNIESLTIERNHFENLANVTTTAPDIYIENASIQQGVVNILFNTFNRTSAPDAAAAPANYAENVCVLNSTGNRMRDSIVADYTAYLQWEGSGCEYTLTGDYIRVGEGASSGTSVVIGSGTVLKQTCSEAWYNLNGGGWAPYDKCTKTDLTVTGTLKVADGARLEVDGLMGPGGVTDAIHVVSNAFTPTGRVNRIDCNGSGTCDVNTINGCSSSTFGDEIIVLPATSAQDPTLKSSVDNLRLDGDADFFMGSTTKVASLMCNATNWIETGRAANAN